MPVTALRGAQGGWQLEKGWRTQVPGLDAAELRALLMAQPRALSEPRLAAAAERALGKLMASLPGSMREQAIAMRERLHVDANDWRPVSEDLSMLPAVQDAVARDCRLSFDYTRADGERGSRVVESSRPGCEGNELVSGGAYATRHADIPRLAYARCYATSHLIPAACAFRPGKALEKIRQRIGSPAATVQSHIAFVSAGRGIADSMVCCNTGSNTSLRKDVPAGWIAMHIDFESEEQALFVALGMGVRARRAGARRAARPRRRGGDDHGRGGGARPAIGELDMSPVRYESAFFPDLAFRRRRASSTAFCARRSRASGVW